jgi:hypothetical protein
MSALPQGTSLRLKNIDRWSLFVVLLALPIFSGLAAGQLSVNPTNVSFGTVNVGTSQSATVTVTNESGSTIKVSNVAVFGTGFSKKGLTTPLIISARQSSTFSVIFDPQSAVAAKGGIVVVSDASNSPQRVTLTGTGWVPIRGTIPPQFMGLDVHPEVLTDKIPWPTMPFGSIRLWATLTQWSALNPSLNTYDWTPLDSWLNMAAQNGKTDLLYTFGVVPQWASSKPNDQTCVSGYSLPGSCDAPYDLNADGSGPDLIWQNFVTALVRHAAGRIQYWELWNEPDCPYEWSGTNAQLVRMAKDAYAIIKAADPTAMVTTPSVVDAGAGKSITLWLPAYLAAGGGAYADIVAFHGYVNPAMGQPPEMIASIVDQVTAGLNGSLSSKPIWDTEGAWTLDSNLPDAELQAAFVARVYLLQWFKGVSRFYWFQYGNTDTGSLWVLGGANVAETAYGQVYDWLVGATLSGPCTATGTVWTCSFTKPGGVQEQAVWDASKTCTNNNCTTSTYKPSSVYTQYADLAGDVTSFEPGASIQIGAKPVLLENQ